MRLFRLSQYGEPEVLRLEEGVKPVPGPDEVLIRVEVIGINYADTMHRRGIYPIQEPLPRVLAADVVGIIEETGNSVTTVQIGERVVAIVNAGYAEYVVAPARAIIVIPASITPLQATAYSSQGPVAYHALRTAGRLQKGESVLIHAAAGGVGSLAVQLARVMGAGHIIATASTSYKRSLARSLGADATVDYTQTNWPEKVREANGGKGVDIILEMVGGSIFDGSVQALAPFGRLVFFGIASGKLPEVKPLQFMNFQSFIGFSLPYLQDHKPEILQQTFTDLTRWIQTGQVYPVIEHILPFEDAVHAHKLVETRQAAGKVVLTLDTAGE